jgi:GNAT superfamily N-acetyltransferase
VEGRAAQLSAAPLRVRPGVVGDVPALQAVERAAGERFRSVGMDAVADDDPPIVEVLERAARQRRLWVAELDGTPVGYAMADEVGGGPHLEQISVVPSAGGHGVGGALLEAVVSWAEGVGGDLTLSTFRDVRWNAPWYERFGFEVVPDAELTDELREVRHHEAELGLDVEARVIMRRSGRRP